MRKLIFVVGFLFTVLPLEAKDLYIAQSAAGAGNGSSCSNAYAYTFFNTSGNWGTGSSQIGPDTIVHVCGTMTSPITFQGSGTPGHVIELLFEPNAKFSTPALSGSYITTGTNSYLLIDGGTNGIIENTANGTNLGNQVASNAIRLDNNNNSSGHDLEVRNLTIQNMYVRVPGSDESIGARSSNGIVSVGTGSNVYIHNNTVTYGHTNIGLLSAGNSPTNWDISNNTTANATWGIEASVGSSPAVVTDIKIHNNDVNNGPTWYDPSGFFHVDGIFVYGQSSTGYANGVYVYNNYVHGDWGPSPQPTAWIYINQNLQNVFVFNNVIQQSGNGSADGLLTLGSGNLSNFVFNNTFVGYSTTSGGSAMGDVGSNAANSTTIENNVFLNFPSAINYSHGGTTTLVAVNYNAYSGITGAGQCGAWSASSCTDTLAGWQALGWDLNGIFADLKLSSSYPYTLQSGSAAIGMAANLYTLCSGKPNPGLGALCYDKTGKARPSSGKWDAGAYSYGAASSGSTTTVQPPTGLTATAN